MKTAIETGQAKAALPLPFSDSYLAKLTATVEAAKRVKEFRNALREYDAMTERRRAALDDALSDAMTDYLRAREAMQSADHPEPECQCGGFALDGTLLHAPRCQAGERA